MKNKKITNILLIFGFLFCMGVQAAENQTVRNTTENMSERIEVLEAENSRLKTLLQELSAQLAQCQNEKDQLECELIAERAGENEGQRKVFVRALSALKLLLKQREKEVLDLKEEITKLRKETI